MKTYTYTIQDPLGIHARPAGLMARLAKEYPDTTVTLTKGDSTVRITQLIRLMGLTVKAGDTVTVTAEGPAEEAAIAALRTFLEEHL